MDKMVYAQKFSKWMQFAKAHEIRKNEACPFLMGVVKSLGVQVSPVHFWPLYLKLTYYILAFLVPWLALAQYFSKNFMFNATQVHWDNIIISIIGCSVLGGFLAYWTHRKAAKLKLPSWEEF